MESKHPKDTKSIVDPHKSTEPNMSEPEKKKLEMADAMEHEAGKSREETEEEIEDLDQPGS